MIKLKFVNFLLHDDVLYSMMKQQTKDGEYWNDLKIVNDDSYDFMVIINGPHKEKVGLDPKRIILFYLFEPSYYRRKWHIYRNPDPSYFFYVNKYSPIWWEDINKTYTDFMTDKIEKTKVISSIVGHKYRLNGHKRRVDFLKYLDKLDNYDHFGKGYRHDVFKNYKGSIKYKNEGLYPYKYTFNGENSYENDYFTEKIIDPILCECLCFYDGCPNLHEYINPDAYIKIDTSNPDIAIETIKKCISDNEWEKRIEIIRKEKHDILNKKQLFPLVETILKEKGVI